MSAYTDALYDSQFVYTATPTGVRRRRMPTETPEDRADEWPTSAELEADGR